MELIDFNRKLDDINTTMELTIPHIDPADLSIWIPTGKHYLSLIKKIIKLETLKAKEEAVSRQLVQRAEDTVTNQSRMLFSILDRDFHRIVIDRIVTVDSNNVLTLHTNPDDILKIASTQYRALTYLIQHHFDSIIPEC